MNGKTSQILAFCVLLTGCARQASEVDESEGTESTTGGETEVVDVPTTIPIPVPQPGEPREQLSSELRRVWERVEMAIQVAPPEPPGSSTEEAVNEWAEGPFADWLVERRVATDHALEAMQEMADAPLAERAMGTALFGYLYEDMVSGIRGAPVPEDIASDPELLAIYIEALSSALTPFARLSAQAYYGCVALFQQVEDPAWAEWPPYCAQRGEEMVEIYDLAPDEPEAEPEEIEPTPLGPGVVSPEEGEDGSVHPDAASSDEADSSEGEDAEAAAPDEV